MSDHKQRVRRLEREHTGRSALIIAHKQPDGSLTNSDGSPLGERPPNSIMIIMPAGLFDDPLRG